MKTDTLSPGKNFIYEHLNRKVKKYGFDMIDSFDPGHGGQTHRLTYRCTNHDNIQARAYNEEEGTITTAFDKAVLKDLDHFHLAIDTIDRLPQTGEKGQALKQRRDGKLFEHKQYINLHSDGIPWQQGKAAAGSPA